MEDRKRAHEMLLNNWQKKRPANFTSDGPSNWEEWEKQKPKVLFLIKESTGGDWQPSIPKQLHNSRFSKNAKRWSIAISDAYNTSALSKIEPQELQNFSLDNLAFIEIKKQNEQKSSSTSKDINSYAEEDREFLKEQLRLVDPNVVVCCGTHRSYEIVYNCNLHEDNEFFLRKYDDEKVECSVWKHHNRAIINFYHPSARINDNSLYEGLYNLLKSDKMFENFDW